jgi:RNA polymerase sigma factor for flagellar operon FliA
LSEAASTTQQTPAEREALILEHLPLLHHIVGRLALELPARIDREDLTGYGMIGLVAAADSFDAGRGLQFSTYAYSRIRGAILDELRRLDFLPRGRRERVRELEQAFAALEQRLSHKPAPEDLARELGWSLDEVDECLCSAKSAGLVSLDEGPESDLFALLQDPSCADPSGALEHQEVRQLLINAIAALPEPDRTVITLYYGEGLLLRDIGQVLDVTESRVSQIHTRAIYRLNKELSGRLSA